MVCHGVARLLSNLNAGQQKNSVPVARLLIISRKNAAVKAFYMIFSFFYEFLIIAF
jgi:hypothetical protein